MRQWIVDQVGEPTWGDAHIGIQVVCGTACGVKGRLLELYDELFGDFAKDLPSLLFGNGLSNSGRKTLKGRLAALGGALSGMTPESIFRPSLLPAKQLQKLVGVVGLRVNRH
jgi:hypothetical protein